ncbi:MAG: fumarylacetoacetate hydrolase family protein [Rhodospirillales bacterium]|nr:fumarylacetoacetate hydrolase family protein [Rhodospirillales bacterium]
MKLVRFAREGASPGAGRAGILLDGDTVGDLRAAYAACLIEREGDPQGREIAALRFPGNWARHLAIGAAGRDALATAADWLSGAERDARGPDGEPIFLPLAEVRLDAPAVPNKIIAVGRNYLAHLEEAGTSLPMSIPSSWIKATSSLIGPYDDVVKPTVVEELDYETELTLVIGERCRDVPEDRAYEVIAGYTVLNDISARDVVRRERAEGNQMLGKMFDGFAPSGPWIVTSDEIADPMDLAIRTRINGETRQDSRTERMIWSIPKLIAFLSQMTLEPGDLITTGTPEGVAMGRKEEPSWFLQDGDVIESEVEGVGIMRNSVVQEPPKEGGWQW